MEPKLQKYYHLVGVAGVGMSALAQVLLAQGHRVTGSDRYYDQKEPFLDVFRKLKRIGVFNCFPKTVRRLPPVQMPSLSAQAIEDDNADLFAARAGNIPVIHRADMLATLSAGHTLVGVTGTSGKTTVTGMIGWILECLGQDPTVVNGGAVINWRSEGRIGNVRMGRSNLWVMELDESDRSLLRFTPDWAVVNNLSKDHFELLEAQSLFREFTQRVRLGVVCGPGVSSLLWNGSGSEKKAAAVIEEPMNYFEEAGLGGFHYKGLSFHSPLMGRHNVDNAHVAVALCDRLGMNLAAVRKALSSFAGVERRLEKVGEANGVTMIDDYARQPGEDTRKLAGFGRRTSPRPGCLAASRLWSVGVDDERADRNLRGCLSTERPTLYYAGLLCGGAAQRKAESDELVRALRDRGKRALWIKNYDELLTDPTPEALPGDAVLCMGARDPQLPLFARRLVDTLKSRMTHVA